MDRIDIHTNLDGFVLLDRISSIDKTAVTGHKHFTKAPLYLGIETLAQLGACHVRFITDFEKHAFLLKVNQCIISGTHILDGKFKLEGHLQNHSQLAYTYSLKAFKDKTSVIKGEFLFALADFDENFNREILQKRYKELLTTLSASKLL